MKDLESLYDLSTGIYMKKGKKTWGAERSGGGGASSRAQWLAS